VKLRFIGNAPFFSALSREEQERVSQEMHLEHHRKGEALFHKGDESGTLYLVKTGWVRLLTNGGTALASQGPGALVGETDLFLDRPRSFGAIAATDLELWALGREDLITLIADNPQIGIQLSLAFGQKLALFEHYLIEQRLKPLDFFSGLEAEALEAIANRLLPVEKAPGEFVVESGQPPEALFVVETGYLHLLSSEEGGDYCEIGPGESFGEMAILTGKPHARSVQASDHAILWVLSAGDFEALTEQYPQIRLALSQGIRERLLPEDQTRAVERLVEMPLFSGLSEDVLWAVTERLLLLHVPAGEMIFAEGQRGDAVYVIDSGQVEIFADEPHGRTIMARLGEEDFFGEMALLTGKPRSTGARATVHSNLWALYRSDFDDLVNRYPSLSMAMSKVLSERLSQMDRQFAETHLRNLKLLGNLTPAQLDDVAHRLKAERYRQGETIIREGEPGREMYFIESGRVRMAHQRGEETVLLDELQAGGLFGEMALLTGKPRWATVTALTDVNLWTLSQADFDELVTAYPNLALALSRLLSERLRRTETRFLQSAETGVSGAAMAPGEIAPAAAPAKVPAPRRKVAAPARARSTRGRRPRPRPAKARRAAPRRSASSGPLAELGGAVQGLVTWFGNLSPAAKVRLVLLTMALVWLLFIATPYLVISTLAADNVTNLEGAIAFVQTATPLPTDPPPPTDVPPAIDTFVPTVAEELPAAPEAAEIAEPLALQAPATEMLESDVQKPSEAPTATPWIIVVTNTPPPPTDTPIPTDTPVPPTATPKPKVQSPAADTQAQPTPTPAEKPQPARDLDPRLSALGVSIIPADVQPGQNYWRLVSAKWQNKEESGNDHTIYLNVLTENGSRIVGQPVEIRWQEGSLVVFTEDKPPTEWSANFPMYGTLGSYSLSIAGLPSDTIAGMGMGTPEQPNFTIHTNFLLVFQRTMR
jgi:CRP-like cAMP-binding protein